MSVHASRPWPTHRCDKRLQRLQKFFVNAFIILSTFISICLSHSNLRLVGKLEEISYSETLFRGLNNESSSATVTATKIISGQDNST